MRVVCSLGLLRNKTALTSSDLAIDHLQDALDKAAEMGAEALSGVTYGGIGEKTGVSPTAQEYDNVARTLEAAAKYAKNLGIALGIEPVNRYETYLILPGRLATRMIELVVADIIFIHLDTYHMYIEEKGVANGILIADYLRYIHLSESDNGTPGVRAIEMKYETLADGFWAAWLWRALSICHLKLPMVWPYGDDCR